MVHSMRSGLAAIALGVLVASANAQPFPKRPAAPAAKAPIRAYYATGEEGNPRVYYVTGVVPPDKLPALAPSKPELPAIPVPSAPSIPPTPAQNTRSLTAAGRQGTPSATIPLVSEPTATVGPVACSNGARCNHCNKGPTSFWTCAWTPAIPAPPLGDAVREAFAMQRDNALAEYFVVYREDWLDSTLTLNIHGARHLDGIIRRFGMIGAPIRVEETGLAALDAGRLSAIVEKLVQAGVSPQDAGSRVRFGTTRAEGLRYHDIDYLFNRMGGTTGGTMGYGMGGFGMGMGGFGMGMGMGMGGFGGIGGFR